MHRLTDSYHKAISAKNWGYSEPGLMSLHLSDFGLGIVSSTHRYKWKVAAELPAMKTVIKRHGSLPPWMTGAPVFVSWWMRRVKSEEALSLLAAWRLEGRIPPLQVKVGRGVGIRAEGPWRGTLQGPISLWGYVRVRETGLLHPCFSGEQGF